MTSLREVIRSIIRDDALYRRKDLPGDLDDPVQGTCGSQCSCQSCAGDEDFVNPKYALYSMIGDAISMYDSMEEDHFQDDDRNEKITRIAELIRSMKD